VRTCEQRNGGDKVYKNFDEMPVMLSVNQAAEVFGISNVSLYKLIEKDKSFPVVQLGRRKSIPKEQLKEWIDEKSKSRDKCLN
jgi:excisionase family DNA binding protein